MSKRHVPIGLTAAPIPFTGANRFGVPHSGKLYSSPAAEQMISSPSIEPEAVWVVFPVDRRLDDV